MLCFFLPTLALQAGLFSAVVTTFTVDSYKSLAPSPPPDASTQLLARISLQLESFAFGGMFVNSTTPSLSLVDATQAASDTTSRSFPVDVNILWIVSLALSLLSALYAIAAQQWLRHLRIPSHLSAQAGVRLLQTRYESLHYWQVPGIISLLPVLLQSAVILFLIGFIILLQTMDYAAAITLVVVGGGGITVFLIAAALPLWETDCAYKSSLVPAVTIALQVLSYPVAVVLAICFRIPTVILEIDSVDRVLRGFRHSYFYQHYIGFPDSKFHRYLSEFGAHILVDLNTFWTDQELRSSPSTCHIRGLFRAAWNLQPYQTDPKHSISHLPDVQGEWWTEALTTVLAGLRGSYATARGSRFFHILSPWCPLAEVHQGLWSRLQLGLSTQERQHLLAISISASAQGFQDVIVSGSRLRPFTAQSTALVICHGACQGRCSLSRDFTRSIWSVRVARISEPKDRQLWHYHVHVLLLFEYRRHCFENFRGESRCDLAQCC